MKRAKLNQGQPINPPYDRQTSIEEFENHEKTINDQFAMKNEIENVSEVNSEKKPLSQNELGGGSKQTMNNQDEV